MSRNLVVCCAGTWNEAWKIEESKRFNVWRFYEAVAVDNARSAQGAESSRSWR